MRSFRKIKIFKFADYASYEECQESANDYYSEILAYNIEASVEFTIDFIAILMPEKHGLSLKTKGVQPIGSKI